MDRSDHLMNRFDENGLRRFRARDAIVAVAVTALLLVAFEGGAIRRAGDQMKPGPGRALVRLVGAPTGWLADQLPLASLADRATAWLSPDEDLSGTAGLESATGAPSTGVTADAFDPATIGERPAPKRSLQRLLVTGDSLAAPLDVHLARRLSSDGVNVVRDVHLGTGISKTFTVDWGQLAASQVKRNRPDAVVVFIGANEGFPMRDASHREVGCCSARWAAVYANRVRQIANTYQRAGAANVYWVTVPTPRDPDRQRISRVVNAAIDVGVAPWRARIRVVDSVAMFARDGYHDAIDVDGTMTIVRRSDGIHLNDAGAEMLADTVMSRIDQDFTYGKAP